MYRSSLNAERDEVGENAWVVSAPEWEKDSLPWLDMDGMVVFGAVGVVAAVAVELDR